MSITTPASSSYRWLFWFLAILGLCLDQGSKYGVFAWLEDHPSSPRKVSEHQFEVIPDVFYLVAEYSGETESGETWQGHLRGLFSDKLPVVNHGALWGIGGRDESGTDYNHLFAVVSVVAVGAIVIWSFRRVTAADRWLCISLGLILAGTLGNLYDRVVFFGVRDFLQWVYLYYFPRFNVADSCLVVGAALLLVQAFFAAPVDENLPLGATAAVSETAPASEPQIQPAEAR